MRFSRSLRKTIAAYLAFTTLTIPIAGCDFLDGVFDDGKPPASTSGKKNESELPKEALVLDRSRVSVERLMVEEAFCRSVRQYLTARLATERAARLDKATVSKSDAVKIIRKAADEWKCLEEMLKRTQRMAKRLESHEQITSQAQRKRASLMHAPGFFSRAYAAGRMGAKEGTTEWAQQVQAAYDSFPAGQQLAGLTKALGAANPKEAYDKLVKAGEIVKKQGKWDVAKSTAQGLGKGTAVVVGIALVAAAPVGVCSAANAMNTLVSSGSAVGTGLGLAAFGVGLTAVTSGTIAAGMQLGEDMSGKKMEGNAAKARDYVDYLSLTSGACNIVVSGGTAIYKAVTTAAPGASKTQIAKEALKEYFGHSKTEIAYNAYGTYDVGKGLVEKGMDLLVRPTDDGKTALVPVERPKDEPPVEAKPIEKLSDEELSVATATYEADGTPEEKTERVKQLETMQQQPPDKDDWIHWNANGITKAEYDLIMKEYPTNFRDHVAQRLKNYMESDEYKKEKERRDKEEAREIAGEDAKRRDKEEIREILAEDARRRQEIADAENRRREEAKRNQGASNGPVACQVEVQRRVRRNKEESNPSQNRRPANQDLPYESSKLAGYYTITSPSGDLAMRAYIKATGDKTIRVIQVQKKTDTKGKPLFSATIDPKTGSGKTDQGVVIKFWRDDSGAYTASMNDGHKTWRFVKH